MDSVKLGAAQSSTNLTSISEEFMATQGEWQLKNMEIINYTFIKDGISRSKLTYMVRKHLQLHLLTNNSPFSKCLYL